jgi:hypothetical protein
MNEWPVETQLHASPVRLSHPNGMAASTLGRTLSRVSVFVHKGCGDVCGRLG